MSAMGERFLILEETADALDVMDPELARQFRLVNGLPGLSTNEVPAHQDPPVSPEAPSRQHRIHMDDDVDGILVECSCGDWSAAVGWDAIDELVAAVREHLAAQGTLDEAFLVVDGPVNGSKSTDRRRAS
jgi:hypothetical protein